MEGEAALVRYVTVSEMIFINGRLLNDAAIMTGKQKIRDVDLLLAAEQRPQASAFGQDAYTTLAEKAAALLHSVARNHPFKDGNKRTALLSALFMLHTNGADVAWDAADALNVVLDAAEGRTDSAAFAAWLTPHLVAAPNQAAPEADLERDTHIIDALITEHRWLLTELAAR